jgi:hypothetical protein
VVEGNAKGDWPCFVIYCLPEINAKDDMGWSGGRGAHNLTTDDDD